MKQLYLIFLFVLSYLSLAAQYFFTGEVKGPHGDKLQNGSILVRSTGSLYNPGGHGEFEITSRRAEDSLTLSFDGYAPYTTAVSANTYLQVTLKKPSLLDDPATRHIKCVYTGLQGDNSFVDHCGPVSFNGHIGQASYGIVERFLNMGYTVPSEAVQIEELLNHFNFHHDYPEDLQPFHCSSTQLACPWNVSHKLLCLNICARKIDLQNIPGANLVLLIDASGSMDLPNKLPIIKSGIRLLIDNLRDDDNVSIIAFGGRVRTLLEGVPGSEKRKMIRAIEELAADGSTPGEEGLKMAYEVARRHFISGGNNRIVLITDGDIGEDPGREKELEDFITEQSQEHIGLDCIGVGTGDLKDSRLPVMAQLGHGSFGYAGNEEEAEALLAGQLTTASLEVADSVSITTDLDTVLVKGYRLIGYDNKRPLSEDSVFHLTGSKVCSGHSLIALFELIPKYDSTGRDTIGTVQVNYCLHGQKTIQRQSYYCRNTLIPFERIDNSLRRAICIAMLGMKLREGSAVRPAATQISWADIERMAKKNFAGSDYMDKEYMALVAKAIKVYARSN